MKMPTIGLGTWKLYGAECEKAVHQALELGYRHIDTADVYDNHEAIAAAIHTFPRDQLFITSKLWMNDLTPAKVEAATTRFLDELRTDYLDLLLIHWPSPDVDLVETLKAMHVLQKKGMTRAIGVSNFVRFNLEALDPYNFPILTNQIELHPYLQRNLLVAACRKRGIGITAYRPLAEGSCEQDPVLQKIAQKYGKSPSQVALKWLLQKDYVVIPKAAKLQHLKDNINLYDFNLTDQDLAEIAKLDANRRYCAPSGLPVYDD